MLKTVGGTLKASIMGKDISRRRGVLPASTNDCD